MAQFASDVFTGTEGTELSTYSGSWTKITGTTGNMEIASNRLRQSSTTSAGYYHSGTPVSADYSVSCDLYNPSGGASLNATGVVGRCSTSATTFYHARSNIDNLQLYKCITGTFTQLGSNVTKSISSSTSYGLVLEMVGTTIKVYWNGSGSASITQTDSSITAAGKSGIRSAASSTPTDFSGWQIDNFSADDIGGATNTDSAASSGSITLSGSAAYALRTHLGVAASGSVTITGRAANGVYTALNNVASAADAGTITLTGIAANAVRAHLGVAASGTITLTGSAANGVYTAVGAYNANAESGSVAVTGAAAVGRHDYLAAAGVGSIAISGSAANATKGLGATADSGSIVLTGSNALAIRTWLASADAGSISITGSSANGVASTTSTGTLDPATIAAIADAVWAHSTAVDFADKMLICSRILRNRTTTDPVSGIMTVYADDGVTPYLTAQLYENMVETQTYRGQGAEVRERLQ